MFFKQKAVDDRKEQFFMRYGIKPLPKREKETFVMPSLNDEFVPIVEDFVKVMQKNFDEEALQSLYHNLKTLKIKYMKENPKHPTKLEGSYKVFFNTIYVKRSAYEDALYHELLHVASRRKHKRTVYSGFHVVNDSSIGYSLNEGYTDALTRRLFNKNETYNYESLVSLALEEIIGKKIMGKFYLNGDVHSLINELSKYKDIDSIESFLVYTDLVTTRYITENHIEYKKRLIEGMKNSITKYLIESFVNKNKDKESFLYDYKEYLLFLNCLVSDKNGIGYRLTDDMIDENICDLSEFDIKKGLKKVS